MTKTNTEVVEEFKENWREGFAPEDIQIWLLKALQDKDTQAEEMLRVIDEIVVQEEGAGISYGYAKRIQETIAQKYGIDFNSDKK